MVSQELSLFPALSVEENLLLAPGGGAWQARRAFGRRAQRSQRETESRQGGRWERLGVVAAGQIPQGL